MVLADRANYGRLKPVMHAISTHAELELQVVAAGTMMLERFGLPVQVVRADGFRVDGEIYNELEGSVPATMARSVGLGVMDFANEFGRLTPDVVLLIGDRYETLAAAIAAAYMNICVAHIQGGEVSGSIDESARHAITKFAHFHFPSTRRAARYLTEMGEHPDTILAVGCPGSDTALQLDRTLSPKLINGAGSGIPIDTSQPFLLVIYHPTTTEYGREDHQLDNLLATLYQLRIQSVLLWPNIDAGSDRISKAIRRFRDFEKPDWLRVLINLSPEDYLKVLANTACAIGNSSSFVREAGIFGTPVVLVGNRQDGRETDVHVTRVGFGTAEMVAAIRRQLQHGPFPPSTLYGKGQVSQRIADGLACLTPYVQKRLHHAPETNASQTRASGQYVEQGNGVRSHASSAAIVGQSTIKDVESCVSSE